MRRPIENNSSPGQAVYDPFLGSGTTVVAAEMTGRACLALEIAPGYIDVAVERWQAYTGEQAVLDGDGRTFEAIAAQRKAPKKTPGGKAGRQTRETVKLLTPRAPPAGRRARQPADHGSA
jgi:hypothetical protein